ncbi:unnamed protein product, partial [Cochlearia groenlandica]
MKTMISDLPRDLIEEILTRVSLRSMRALRLTCKKWDNLTKTTSFTKKHVAKSTTREGENPMIISVMNHNLYVVDPYAEPKGKVTCISEQVKISRIFHCDGLLLCISNEKYTDTRLVVMNPYTSQTRWIEPRYSQFPYGWDRFTYALGYSTNKSCRSYKFLRFIDYLYDPEEQQFFWYEIYDFETDSWKTLDVKTPHWKKLFCDHGVTLKGNTYWPAKERTFQDEYYTSIICFDFTKERFGPLLPLPVSLLVNEYEYVTLSCVREDKLAALFKHNEPNPYELEIWITTKIEVENVSWSKFLKFVREPEKRKCVPYISEGFFIDEEKKVAMGFSERTPNKMKIIGEDGYVRKFDFGANANYRTCRAHLCSYVPSLVQIKNQACGTRKKED